MTKAKKTNILRYSLSILFISVMLIIGIYLFMYVYMSTGFFMLYIASLGGLMLLYLYTDKQIHKLDAIIEQFENENKTLNDLVNELKHRLEEKNYSSGNENYFQKTHENLENLFVNFPPFKEKEKFSNMVLSALGEHYEIVIGLFFIFNEQSGEFSVEGNYGIMKDEPVTPFSIGDGLHGTALKEKEVIVLEELPEDYFSGYSGLGESKPKYIYILPVANDKVTIGVLEIASFKPLDIKEDWEEINRKLIELTTES